MRFLTLLLLAFVFLGCHAEPVAEPISTSTDFPATELVPNGAKRIEIPPDNTPEAAPRMILSVRLYDDGTGKPINDGNVYWIAESEQRPVTDADLRAKDAWGTDIYLGGEADGWLVATARGYEDYAIRVKYRIVTSRWLDVPARLKRIGEGGA